ncbi:hypothetical protein [Antrihabitans sp. YC2-6]|uniref:hypothetical protein n=1 Tax=Antrihabitans sp. YC2-6 TaxID=2799498 RepID=UPI0018F2A52F|nr:hypothetical protein [Antrihabitans sp. YC2-6]MBJ8343197.1 hypothetical protein [Antrihabitans sp. YC2-6]
MLVLTLALAAVGFALLVIALMTGSVVWAWGCILACAIGACVLLGSALTGRTRSDGVAPNVDEADAPKPKPEPRKRGRHEKPAHG